MAPVATCPFWPLLIEGAELAPLVQWRSGSEDLRLQGETAKPSQVEVRLRGFMPIGSKLRSLVERKVRLRGFAPMDVH